MLKCVRVDAQVYEALLRAKVVYGVASVNGVLGRMLEAGGGMDVREAVRQAVRQESYPIESVWLMVGEVVHERLREVKRARGLPSMRAAVREVLRGV